jgi:hypothetical protein
MMTSALGTSFVNSSDAFKALVAMTSAMMATASLHFSPGIVARARRWPWLQGAREKMRGGVAYTTLSTFSERNAVDAGRYPVAVDSW